MNYAVIELQTNAEGPTAALINSYTSKAAGEAAYHSILSVAAGSNVLKHGAIIISDDFRYIKREIYDRSIPEENEESDE